MESFLQSSETAKGASKGALTTGPASNLQRCYIMLEEKTTSMENTVMVDEDA